MTFACSLHLAVTWMFAGLIWVIQFIAYPQFLRVGKAEFVAYHFAHCLRIGVMVGILMPVEAATAAWLLYQGHREPAFLASVALMPVIWLSTAVLQAPLHTKLMKGFSQEVVRRLILTNWLRTLAWTARGILVACAFAG